MLMRSLVTQYTQSRRWRQFNKQSYGDEVAARLNSATPTPAVLRVRAIVERLKALFELTENLEAAWQQRGAVESSIGRFLARSPFSDYSLDDPHVAAIAERISEVTDQVDSLLTRYRWHPAIRVNPDGTLRQTVSWSQLDEETEWEMRTVHWLLSDLPKSPQEKGACSHFCFCERCGDWFYAGREGARFCKSACRVMSHNQTEQGRAGRALYMRQLRKKKAEKERKRAVSLSNTANTQRQPPANRKGQTSRTEKS